MTPCWKARVNGDPPPPPTIHTEFHMTPLLFSRPPPWHLKWAVPKRIEADHYISSINETQFGPADSDKRLMLAG